MWNRGHVLFCKIGTFCVIAVLRSHYHTKHELLLKIWWIENSLRKGAKGCIVVVTLSYHLQVMQLSDLSAICILKWNLNSVSVRYYVQKLIHFYYSVNAVIWINPSLYQWNCGVTIGNVRKVLLLLVSRSKHAPIDQPTIGSGRFPWKSTWSAYINAFHCRSQKMITRRSYFAVCSQPVCGLMSPPPFLNPACYRPNQ